MNIYDYEDYEEEYGVGGYEKSPKKNSKMPKIVDSEDKKSQRKRRSKNTWSDADNNNLNELIAELVSDPQSPKAAPSSLNNPPASTVHTIKDSIIDFARVKNIEKVEKEYEGKMTYGIKFYFVGKKGLSRIAWFNKNMRERDKVFISEYQFWQTVQKK